MRFLYSAFITETFPSRVTGFVYLDGVTPEADVSADVARFQNIARARLANGTEGSFPEIQAWRRAYATMGLKPTQYRCAAEALLRRFRKVDNLPRLHPLVDLCNAASLAFAVPVAVFDLANVAGDLTVCQATGHETYLDFSGRRESPDIGEVIFADAAGEAHARRWAHRQSRASAVDFSTRRALIVSEAHHGNAEADIADLITQLGDAIGSAFAARVERAVMAAPAAVFATSS